MERRGYVATIQGGGDGIVFKTPRQILQVEPQRASQLSREMSLRGSQLQSTTIDQPGESQRHLIWMRELEYRLFLLRQRRAEQDIGLGSSAAPRQIGSADQNEQQEEPHVDANPFLSKSPPSRINTPRNEPINGPHSQKTSPHVLIKFIPGLPKTVEKAITLWRCGNEKEGYKAVRLFEKVEARRELIPNYEDRLWALSGQKNCFFRFKAVAELVSEFGPVASRLDSEGSDEHLNTAIQKYHAQLDRNGKPISLTAALKRANDF